MRYVLSKSTTIKDVDRYAENADWELYSLTPRSTEQPLEKIWRTPDRQTAIHLVQGDLVAVDYLFVQGAGVAECARTSVSGRAGCGRHGDRIRQVARVF